MVIFNVLISVTTFHQVLMILELLPSLPSDWIWTHRPMRIFRYLFPFPTLRVIMVEVPQKIL